MSPLSPAVREGQNPGHGGIRVFKFPPALSLDEQQERRRAEYEALEKDTLRLCDSMDHDSDNEDEGGSSHKVCAGAVELSTTVTT